MKTNKINNVATISMLLLTGHLHAQVVNMNEELPKGKNEIVTTMGEGTIDGSFGATDELLFQWEETLKEFDEFDGADELDRMAKSYDKGTHKKLGKLNLPQIIDENGTDLFLLTEDGINIYAALDSPVYYQNIDKDIIKWIRFYAHHRRTYTKTIFKRYEAWAPQIKEYFKESGIPEELAELCLIESGCTYTARSSAGAVGMWQLMPATARQYGLIVTPYNDERTDPNKSLYVASRVLANCYKMTGDWTLAAAAYNCGPGRIIPYTKRGIKDWPYIKQTLPKETQQYVPGLIAMHYVWTYRKELGF